MSKGKEQEKDFNPKDTKPTYNKGKGKGKSGSKSMGSNDPAWYTQSSQLALDAGRFSFTWPTGAPVNFDVKHPTATTTTFGMGGDVIHFPGVMSLDFVPAYGRAAVPEDPLNVAMFKIYGDVRYANSGHTNYDPPDLMLYLMAMDNIYMVYQFMCRAYGLLRTFAQRNRHYPRTIFTAMHLDYDDLLNHMSDLRMYINVCALKISSLCVPATMPLYLRHMWMSSGVYADAPTVKSQTYIFTPAWVGKYNEKTSTHGGYLEGDASLTTGNPLTFNDLVALFDDMIGRVVQSEDCNIMSGDILKAYGDAKMFKVSMISDDYSVSPVFNPEVLRQIQNATLIGSVGLDNYDNTAVLMYQDPNAGILKSSLTLSDNCVHIAGKRILTGSTESPSSEEVLVNSRLMVAAEEYAFSGSAYTNSTVTFVNPTYGTEIITNARIWDFDTITGDRVYYGRGLGTLADYTTSKRSTDYRINYFNYHPLTGIELQWWSNGALNSADWEYNLAVDDYAIVDTHDIEKTHTTALLSLFNIPQIGEHALDKK